MSRAQEHLAQTKGHYIAELKVQIVRQRVIKYALDTRQPSEMAESL
jgi:hypothetical protein